MQLRKPSKLLITISILLLAFVLVLGACAPPAPAPAPTPKAPTAPAKPQSPADPEAPKAGPTAAAPGKKMAPVIGVEIDTSHPMADDLGPLKIDMPRFLTFSGTSSPGSVYTFFATPAIQNIERVFPDITVRHLPGGTRPNVERVGNGQAELGISVSTEVGMATYPYKDQYPTPMPVLVLNQWPHMIMHAVITKAGSGLDSYAAVAETPGVRLGSLYAGSTITRFVAPGLLEMYGASFDTIKDNGGTVYLATGDWMADLMDKLISDQLDAIWWCAPTPDSQIKSQELLVDLDIIPYTDEEIQYILDIMPGYARFDVPAATYKCNPDEPIPSLTNVHTSFVHSDMSEEMVYNILWALFQDDGKSYQDSHPSHAPFNYIEFQEVATAAPYHPGALKYWAARGIEVPDTIMPAIWD
ncbi:TAXI family TRAP transporter solute-binding subunit [Chloroflexota bacterium]